MKESRELAVRTLNSFSVVVCILEVTGAKDLCYHGILNLNFAAGNEFRPNFRFDKGDRLKINFRTKVEELIQEDNWNFRVLKPYVFMVQGEIVGLLVRPHVPLQPNSTEEEKKKGQPLVKMKPVTSM